jgi:hypothetical protein
METCNQLQEGNREWPEERDKRDRSYIYHAYLCWTYSYMGSILLKGSQRAKANRGSIEKITQNDLFLTPTTMQSSYLTLQFKKHFFSAENKSASSTKWKFIITLWRLAAPTFIPAGFCQLITVLCQVALPLLVRELLTTLEDNPGVKVIGTGMPCTLIDFFSD